jgi:hypothetical protein
MDEQTQGAILALAQFLASGGQQGSAPPWFETVQAARYLGVAPWELNPESHAKRQHWQERAVIALRAEAVAQQMRAQARAAQQVAARNGGIVVPR